MKPKNERELNKNLAGEISSKESRKSGENWNNINVESDELLLQASRQNDIFTLPNPG